MLRFLNGCWSMCWRKKNMKSSIKEELWRRLSGASRLKRLRMAERQAYNSTTDLGCITRTPRRYWYRLISWKSMLWLKNVLVSSPRTSKKLGRFWSTPVVSTRISFAKWLERFHLIDSRRCKKGKTSLWADSTWRSWRSYLKKSEPTCINVLSATTYSFWSTEQCCIAARQSLSSTTTESYAPSMSSIGLGSSRSSSPSFERHIESHGEKSTGRYGDICTFSNAEDATSITIWPSLETALSILRSPKWNWFRILLLDHHIRFVVAIKKFQWQKCLISPTNEMAVRCKATKLRRLSTSPKAITKRLQLESLPTNKSSWKRQAATSSNQSIFSPTAPPWSYSKTPANLQI